MMSDSEQKWCEHVIKVLTSARYSEKSKFFMVPVETVLEPSQWIEYRAIVATPRDLGTIRDQLSAKNTFTSVDDFVEAVKLCFTNAILFNKSRYPIVANVAESLLKVKLIF